MSSSRDFDFVDFGGGLPEGPLPLEEGGSEVGFPFSYLLVVFGAERGPFDSGVVAGGASLDDGAACPLTSRPTSRPSA